MQRFKRILVYIPQFHLSEENAAVIHAAELAERNQAEVTLICVAESFWSPEDDEALQGHVQFLRDRGLDVTAELRWGVPAEEVLREVVQKGHDLVLKTACPEESSPLAFGTTAIGLMRSCPCPVWIVQPEQRNCFRRVLAAIDPWPYTHANIDLNSKILQLAVSLARRHKATVSALHARNASRPSSKYSETARRPASGGAEAEEMARLLAPFTDVLTQDDVHLLEGSPARVIARFARSQDIDILVMGTVARTGIPGLLFGNTTERVLRQVSCSVLAVKPEGFVTPVSVRPLAKCR